MLRYLLHHEIKKDKWDECIDQSDYKIIYGYSWYLDIISPHWEAIVKNDYEAVFPVTWKKKYGLYYLTQPPFAQQLGIFSKKELTAEKIQDFIDAIPQKFIHVDINLNPKNVFNVPLKYKGKPKRTYHVSLQKNYTETYNNYFTDTKKNLKRFADINFRLEKISVEDVIDLYKNNVLHKTPGFKMHYFEILKNLVSRVESKNMAFIVDAFDEEVLSAGGIFFCSHDKLIFLFGLSNRIKIKNGAMRFIFDNLIKNNCNRNMVLDFEGSCVASVEYFYRSFGSDKIIFNNILRNRFWFVDNLIEGKQKFNQFLLRQWLKRNQPVLPPQG